MVAGPYEARDALDVVPTVTARMRLVTAESVAFCPGQ
jgi:hypothetical protein